MKQIARILSIYAADTSGVCSALYELGGMTVVHDASGCNSTYTTHDEPRWFRENSMVYISGMTEMDAIMGGDDRLIADTVAAARELQPKFIALCGSPLPMMIGTDYDALAVEIEAASGIPTFGLHTNGMHSYLAGAADALAAVAERFVREQVKPTPGLSANIIGATPLDFSVNGSVEAIRGWLEDSGFEVIASLAMTSSLENLYRAGSARVNLVVSSCGLAAARQLERRFGTPFVVGVPFGGKFANELAAELKMAASDGGCRFSCAARREAAADGGGVTGVVGEAVYSGSLARALELEGHANARVLCPLEAGDGLLAPGDVSVPDEADVEREFAKLDMVIADPLYAPVCPPAVRFARLPHEAFSGRCFRKEIPNLINRSWKELF